MGFFRKLMGLTKPDCVEYAFYDPMTDEIVTVEVLRIYQTIGALNCYTPAEFIYLGIV